MYLNSVTGHYVRPVPCSQNHECHHHDYQGRYHSGLTFSLDELGE